MSGIPHLPIGLALGSGAARGWAHLGVLRALAKMGIAPDVVCGTSIGALVGGFYLSGYLHTLEDWANTLTKLRIMRYLNFPLVGNGLVSGHRLFGEMESYLRDTTIEDLPAPFAAVATDLQTGREVWLTEGRLVDAIQASFCLPAFFEPKRNEGRWLVDGALVNPVPVTVCRALGAQIVIAVNLNARGTNGRALLPSAPASTTRLARWQRNVAMKSRKRDGNPADSGDPTTPTLLSVVASTLNIVQDRVTRSRLAADPPDVTIMPRVGHVGLLDFHRAAELVEAGYAATFQAEAHIREAMPVLQAATR